MKKTNDSLEIQFFLNKKKEIKEGIRILWSLGYYEGVLSGIAQYNLQKCYFECKRQYYSKELEKKVYRTFWVYSLTKEQLEEFEYWHKEFNIHIGYKSDYYLDEVDKKVKRFRHDAGGCEEYKKEMFWERFLLFNIQNKPTHEKIDRKKQLLGWTTYDCLFQRPWKEWRRRRRRSKLHCKNTGAKIDLDK